MIELIILRVAWMVTGQVRSLLMSVLRVSHEKTPAQGRRLVDDLASKRRLRR